MHIQALTKLISLKYNNFQLNCINIQIKPFFFFIAKLRTHPMILKLKSSPSTTLLLQKENVPFELELIGSRWNMYHKLQSS